ncbi:MAG: DUF6621 family protein [Bacteroidaceae bacterium]
MEQTKWSETVLLVDADFLDKTAFDLIVNLERVINRPIQAGDLCTWLDCLALDSGIRPGKNEVQVLFLYPEGKTALEHFRPASFLQELDGKAFSDNLGEFTLHSFPIESVVSREDFYLQSLETIADSAEVKRLLLVPDMGAYGTRVRSFLTSVAQKEVTLFAMEPVAGINGRAEILGYSLICALGISSEELG